MYDIIRPILGGLDEQLTEHYIHSVILVGLRPGCLLKTNCVFVIHTTGLESSSKCICGAASPPVGTEATVSSGIWPQQLLLVCCYQFAVIRAQGVCWKQEHY